MVLPLCRLQMTEAALALSEQKAQDLGELLATAEQERQSLSQRQEKERKLEQQVGAGLCGLVGGLRCVAAAQPGAALTYPSRKLPIGSLSSSGICLLPVRRTCCLEARYEGCGSERGWSQQPKEPRVATQEGEASSGAVSPRWMSWSGR